MANDTTFDTLATANALIDDTKSIFVTILGANIFCGEFVVLNIGTVGRLLNVVMTIKNWQHFSQQIVV